VGVAAGVAVVVVVAGLWLTVTAGCGVMRRMRTMSSWLGRRWLKQQLRQRQLAGSDGGAW
jgi:hypothetical protein